VLAVYGLIAVLVARDAPGRQVPDQLFGRRFTDALRHPATLPMSLLYAVSFGAFVAMGVYLPTYLKEAYGLSQDGASTRAAGFTLVAVLFRPLGGSLSDRIGPAKVLIGSFGTLGVTAVWQAFQPGLNPWSTVAFLVMAASVGLACGAVFALVANVTPKEKVGTVTGLVGAAGGLGGYFPPAGHGLGLRQHRFLRDRSDAALGRRLRRAGLLFGPAPRPGPQGQPQRLRQPVAG
jgi:NNP family nitrate/nitrite transporter-like MFS transporter